MGIFKCVRCRCKILTLFSVASVYFANGSMVGIAKVEGGWHYKQMMRDEKWNLPWQQENNVAVNIEVEAASERDPQQQRPIHDRASVGQGLRDRLPPWLGGPRPDPRVEVLSRMLLTLKTATESFLGDGQLSHVQTVFPAWPSDGFFEAAQSAAKQLSLSPFEMGSSAGQFAAYANHAGERNCVGERLILAVEYSRAALTTFIFSEWCELYDELRGLHFLDLGSGRSAAEDHEGDLVSAIRRVARLPLHSIIDGTVLDHISGLVVLGENGSSGTLSRALHEVLSTLSSPPPKSGEVHDLDQEMADPVFAASMGAAMLNFGRRNGDGDIPPPAHESDQRVELRK